MSFPFPVGTLSGKEYLTKVTVEVLKCYYGTAGGGFEDETDADGGTNIQTGTGFPATFAAGFTEVEYDLSSDGVLWSERYNYRLGFANVYKIRSMKLYRNDVLVENQGASEIITGNSVPACKVNHCGCNVNPSSRNVTYIYTDANVPYPK